MRWLYRAFFVIILFLILFATEARAQSPTPVSSPTTTQSAIAVTNKTPYRGMLPDHPLYKLQILWDRIQILFMTNPLQKADKYISYATRELEASEAMLEKGNVPLTVHTAMRGEHYMTLVVESTKSEAYLSGDLVPGILERAHGIYPTHQQIVTRMIEKTSGDAQNTLKQIQEFSTRNDMELTKLEQEIMEATPPSSTN